MYSWLAICLKLNSCTTWQCTLETIAFASFPEATYTNLSTLNIIKGCALQRQRRYPS